MTFTKVGQAFLPVTGGRTRSPVLARNGPYGRRSTATRDRQECLSYRPDRQRPIVRRPRAFVLADMLIGLFVVLTLAGLMGTSAVWHRRAADRMADARAATAAADGALVKLAQGHPPGAGVRVEPVSGGEAIPGHAWVRVTATVHGRSATLVGLATGGR